MIYVLDTTRVNAWRRAAPAAFLVAESGTPPAEFSDSDVVFAHTPTDFKHMCTQNELETHTDALRRIKAFRAKLIDARPCDQPRLILYSGRLALGEKRTAKWIQATSEWALPGYPASRIMVLPARVSHDIGPAALRRLVDDFARLDAVGNPLILPAVSNRRAGATDTCLALRLLCEAWTLARADQPAGWHAFCINAPAEAEHWFAPFGAVPNQTAAAEIAELCPTGLRAAALQVLTAASCRSGLSGAVFEFLEAAGQPELSHAL